MRRFLASGFGSGYLPYMPGTWGSLIAVPIGWALAPFCWQWMLVVAGIVFFFGWFLSQELLAASPEDTDPSYIVIDEIAGLLFTYALFQFFHGTLNLLALVLGFLWFRLFDIWKPFPICRVEARLAKSLSTSGLGVMVDDIMAALPAAGLTILSSFVLLS